MPETSPASRLGLDGRVVRIPTPTGLGVGDVHCYLILPEEGGHDLALIDTGVHSEEAWAHLERGFASVGRSIEELTLVLITHAHPDHFGQAARISSVSGCPVWGHQLSPQSISAYTEPPGPVRREAVGAFYESLGVPTERARISYGPPGGISIV